MTKLSVKTIKQMQKLQAAQTRFILEIGILERDLREFIDFDYSIECRPDYGFVLLNTDDAYYPMALLDACLEVINRGEKLTEESHTALSIQ